MTTNRQTETVASPERHELQGLAAIFFDIQRVRVAHQVRLTHLATTPNAESADPIAQAEAEPGVYAQLVEGVTELERRIESQLRDAIQRHPVWTTWLVDVKGVGRTRAAEILGVIPPISKFANVSKLWSFCGMGVVQDDDGNVHAPRRVKGQKLAYSSWARTVLFRVGTGLMMANGAYHDRYTAFRAEEDRKHPDLSDGHRHRRAFRRMNKLFLSHLFEVWRQAEGFEAGAPYVIDVLRHTHYVAPLRG